MLWAKWWTAILAATLLSLTILAARAHAQGPAAAVPTPRLADSAKVVAIDPNLVDGWGTSATRPGILSVIVGQPRVEGYPHFDDEHEAGEHRPALDGPKNGGPPAR